MRLSICRRLAAGSLLLLMLGFSAWAQANLSLKDVLEKNILAAGGREKLGQIQNFTFKSGGARYFVASSGEFKIVTGKDPVVTEVILVKGDKVQRNSFNETSELTGNRKTVNQTLAKLYTGLFSLLKFEDQLEFQGLKTYGAEKLYVMAAKADSLNIEFFLSSNDYFLRHLVFKGQTPEGDKYEVNYDFGPFEETEGVKIPLSWFSSQVGTRGNLTEISEVKTNQTLEKDFFTKLEVNVGTTEAAPGKLKGNVLDSNSTPYSFLITTNWMRKDIEKADLKTNDRLACIIEGVEFEAVFYAAANEMPPQNELAKGMLILAPMGRGGDNYALQFFAVDRTRLPLKLKILSTIEITKK